MLEIMILEYIILILLCLFLFYLIIRKMLPIEIKVNESDIIDKLEVVHEQIFGNLMVQISKQLQSNFNQKTLERQDNKFVYNKIKFNTMKVDIINCFDSDLPLTFYQKTIFKQDIEKVQRLKTSSFALLWFFYKSYLFRYHYLFGILQARSISNYSSQDSQTNSESLLHSVQALLFSIAALFSNFLLQQRYFFSNFGSDTSSVNK